jgi:hypothetical protein
MDWNNPTARLELLERVGHAEYTRLHNAYLDANPIRPVPSRFGTLYAVLRTGKAFSTREQAEEYLRSL